jgi:hypothetical protein
LNEYNSVARNVKGAKGYLKILIDEATRERAEEAHRKLTELVAARIRKAGSIPKNNKYVDLSAAIRDDLYLFEMKSTTDGMSMGRSDEPYPSCTNTGICKKSQLRTS